MFEVFMAAIVMACGRGAAKFAARTFDAGRRASWFVPMIGTCAPSTIESAAAL
ncbi:hypothetical protein [Burkholderia vietnamiensis]|uniref:hypothetical protein n=1 Tax=Burkholderia vietnamiensis TaxID=60552 RepID=UPI0012D875B0|nr:hypothetical protein [Burkholderia vietnamiensis]MDN7927671.1 hypothetical protein [Burkholderia vietnamiensis]HDR9248730.1 hypothetical protein [Burkholderia vietnamiensis]